MKFSEMTATDLQALTARLDALESTARKAESHGRFLDAAAAWMEGAGICHDCGQNDSARLWTRNASAADHKARARRRAAAHHASLIPRGRK